MSETPAPTCGPYELGAELGRGGIGVVYRARHKATGAERAVKVLGGGFAGDPEALVRFRREAEALARVAGVGIVPVHEAGTERGRLWFAMGLMEGGSLRDRLRVGGAVPWPEARTTIRAIGEALARCHAAGIVHRDLKPENVLLDGEGNPAIADFGCARVLDARSLTETGAIIGTPSYMAPEQLAGLPVDARADIFALGAILHELLTGEPPFRARPSLVESLFDRREMKPPRPGERIAGLPKVADAAVMRALAARPEERFASVGELLEALEGGSWKGFAPASVRSFVVPAVLVIVAGVAFLAALLGPRLLRREAGVASVASSAPAPALPSPVPESEVRALVARLRQGEIAALEDLERLVRRGASQDQRRTLAGAALAGAALGRPSASDPADLGGVALVLKTLRSIEAVPPELETLARELVGAKLDPGEPTVRLLVLASRIRPELALEAGYRAFLARMGFDDDEHRGRENARQFAEAAKDGADTPELASFVTLVGMRWDEDALPETAVPALLCLLARPTAGAREVPVRFEAVNDIWRALRRHRGSRDKLLEALDAAMTTADSGELRWLRAGALMGATREGEGLTHEQLIALLDDVNRALPVLDNEQAWLLLDALAHTYEMHEAPDLALRTLDRRDELPVPGDVSHARWVRARLLLGQGRAGDAIKALEKEPRSPGDEAFVERIRAAKSDADRKAIAADLLHDGH